ncbi:MAG: LLM class flavin-dependent oxidoreductase [Actinobacteria bacterium]|nr:LLM class flavin-dependent oxidoreductase [Actinomycetota bacterium]
MKLGLSIPNFGTPRSLISLAQAAEASGWDGLFIWDHVVYRKRADQEMVDPWVVLGAIAASTERIKLGTMITPLSRRRPWKLARETATLDHLSRGRFVLGVGLGNPPDADFGDFGEVSDGRTRAAMLDEGLEVIVGLWSGAPVTHQGEHYQLEDTRMLPPALQTPRIPVWVAGVWPNRAPFRRAARWDGVVPTKKSGETFERMTPEDVAGMKTYIDDHRPANTPYDIVISGWTGDDLPGAPGTIEPFASAGATWWLEATPGSPGWEHEVRARIGAGPPV